MQTVLPAAKGGFGVSSSSLISLPAVLVSAVGAKATLSQIFGLELGKYSIALEFWFDSAKCDVGQENDIQKKIHGANF